MYAGSLSMQKIRNFEPSVQCPIIVGENPAGLANQVAF